MKKHNEEQIDLLDEVVEEHHDKADEEKKLSVDSLQTTPAHILSEKNSWMSSQV